MNRAQFRAAFARLTRADRTDYADARQQLVAAGATVLPWLAEEEASGDVRRATDAAIVRMWIEQPRYVRVCDGILLRQFDPPRRPPNTDDGDRIVLLNRVGAILTPRLLEGLIRTQEYEHTARDMALRVLRALADPRSQAPLRAAMGDVHLPLPLRTEIASTVLWDAFQDTRTFAFAEALARDESTSAQARGWAISFLAERNQREVIPLIRQVLQRIHAPVPELLHACIDAIRVLRHEESAALLEPLLIRGVAFDGDRAAIVSVVAAVRGPAALPVLREAASRDPSEYVRRRARWAIDDIERPMRRPAP